MNKIFSKMGNHPIQSEPSLILSLAAYPYTYSYLNLTLRTVQFTVQNSVYE